MKTHLILIEGLPGSGKSSTAKFISTMLSNMDVKHHCYLEEPDKTPVKFLWPEDDTFKDDLLCQWSNLAEYIKNCDDLFILESVYWQWTTWFMILLNFTHGDVIRINSLLHDIIMPLNPLLVYFTHDEVKNHIQWVYNLRGKEWSDFMIQRDLQLPYHQSRGHKDIKGIIKCFKETQSQYDELFNRTRFHKIKIQDPHMNWNDAYQKIQFFIQDRF